MPNWRIDVNISFEITSDEIDAFESFKANRDDFEGGGPKGDLLGERRFLDSFIGRDWIDWILQWDLITNQPSNRWSINGTNVKSGTDGELVLPSTFKSVGTTLANADVGRVIRVNPGQTPPATRGHYKIATRVGPNEVTVDGVLPVAATGLDFDINEDDAAFLATLLSTA